MTRFGEATLAPIAFVSVCAIAAIVVGGTLTAAAAQTVTLARNHPRAAARMLGARRAAAYRQLDLKLILAPHDRDALHKLLADQQDPASHEYHRWLTPGEFDARFAPAESDFHDAVEWLKSQGFTVNSWSRSDRWIRFAGPLSNAERVFGVTIVSSGDDRFYGNLDDPSVPARFANVIAHIDGLDNLRHFVHQSARDRDRGFDSRLPVLPAFAQLAFEAGGIPGRSQADDSQPQFAQGGFPPAFGPSDVYSFYDERPVLQSGINGAGSDCLALVDDSNYADASVTLFDSTFGLAAANVTKAFSKTDPGKNSDEGEVLLDVEWAHAVAPGSPLRVYIGNMKNAVIDPITDGIQKAVNENLCAVISVSFASCGAPPTFYTGTLDPILAQAASQGQSVFVSAGDNGAAGLVLDPNGGSCVTGTSRNVNEISADPNVTSVGGTEFNPNFDASGNDVGNVEERVWDEPAGGNGATGGGVSAVFPKPSYQAGVTPADGQRDVPDIAFIASADMPGVFLGDDVNGPTIDCCDGGTSLSAPMWGGVSRLIDQVQGARSGNMNPRIYSLASSANAAQDGFRDVTKGSNDFNGVTGFPAGPGYDLSTGWGTPDVAQFVAAFPTAIATPVPGTLALSAKSIKFPPIGIDTRTVTRSFTIKNSGKGALVGSLDLSQLALPFSVPGLTSFNLLHGKSIAIAIQFAPTVVAPFQGSIGVVSNDAKGHTLVQVSVTGTGASGTLAAPSMLAFGKVHAGKTKKMAFKVSNNGPGVLHINIDASGVGAPFNVTSPTGESFLAPGKTMPVDVVFSPTAAQATPFKATITTTSDDPRHLSITTTVSGVAISLRGPGDPPSAHGTLD